MLFIFLCNFIADLSGELFCLHDAASFLTFNNPPTNKATNNQLKFLEMYVYLTAERGSKFGYSSYYLI